MRLQYPVVMGSEMTGGLTVELGMRFCKVNEEKRV